MNLQRPVSSDDRMRLLGGWRDIAEDTARLVEALRVLPAHCTCGDGTAHLQGRCACCRQDESQSSGCRDCAVLVRSLEWKLDAVVDDFLRFLDAAIESIRSHVGPQVEEPAMNLRHALVRFVGSFRTVASKAGEFRRGCRSEHLTSLKQQGEDLLSCAHAVDHLLHPVMSSVVTGARPPAHV